MPHWFTRVLLILGGVVALAALGLAYVMSSDTTTPVAVDDAVGRFRDEDRGAVGPDDSTPADRPVVPPGVYVYATEGSESIDVLGGATHRYPDQTTLTVVATDCGVRQRWTAIEERWDEEELCRSDAGLERRTLHTHHEFFNLADDQGFTCSPGYLVLPADASPGDSWSTDCRADDAHITGTGQVVGVEARSVAGQPVETIHVRIEEVASGSSSGPSRDDYWLRVSDGLLIERISSVQTRSASPVGTAAYEERFALRLTSATPST